MSIWPCSSCSLLNLIDSALLETTVAKRAFAFAQIVITGECIFHFLERAQRVAHVSRGGGFLLGGAKILRSLEFTAKENRLRDPTGQTPDEGIERADPVECPRFRARSWR